MAAGHARVVHEQTGQRVKICDIYNRPRWDPVWEGLPWIVRPGERGSFARIKNGPQCRPYIEYPFSISQGQRWTDWRAREHKGVLALTDDEQSFASRVAEKLGPFVVVEPRLSQKANQNKQWGKPNWRRLIGLLSESGETVVTMGPRGTPPLSRAKFIETPSFRFGAAVLARAKAAILPEGGLHHAAAVLGVKAVVLFGGTISPKTTGYDEHVNIADEGPGSPCGKWKPCAHCQRIWRELKPELVFDHYQRMVT